MKPRVSCAFTLSAILLTIFIMGIVMATVLYVQIRRSASCVASTQKLQIMLFRALIAQMFLGYVFILLPGFAVGLLAYFDVKGGGRVVSALFVFISTHAWLDYLAMIGFIRPY